MRYLIALVSLVAGTAFALEDGTYIINDSLTVTVQVEEVDECTGGGNGALSGPVHELTFSHDAEAEPYEFVSGYYVLTYDDEGEVYTEVDDNCMPYEDGVEMPFDDNELDGWPIALSH